MRSFPSVPSRLRHSVISVALAVIAAVVFSSTPAGGNATLGTASAEATPPGQIAFHNFDDGSIWVSNADDASKRLLQQDDAGEMVWSPDGTKLAYLFGGIVVLNADGTGRVVVADTNFNIGGAAYGGVGVAHNGISWHPSGEMLAYTHQVGTTRFVSFVNADGSGQRDVVEGWLPSWSPDGSLLAYMCPTSGISGSGICLLSEDGSSRLLYDTPRGTISLLSWSPDGSKVGYVVDNIIASNAFWVEVATEAVHNITNFDFYRWVDNAPVWSPDGSKILVGEDNDQMTLFDAAGENPVLLTTGGQLEGLQIWSPDSQWITFTSGNGRSVPWQVMVARADGSDIRNLTNDDTINEIVPAWSPGSAPPCITSSNNGISTCNMQPGDVLLNWDKDMNRAQWWLMAGNFGGYWTHAGIYAGNNQLIESYPPPGVVEKPIKESGFWNEDDWAILRSKSATPDDKYNAVDWASQQADAHLPFNSDILNPWCTDKYYCSQLVWRAYEMQDINVQCDKVPLAVAPDELYPEPLCDVLQGYDLRLVKQRPNMRRAVIQIHSPANLYVTDPLGRHAGVDPATGLEVDEIPDVIYSGTGSEPQVMSIANLDGTWQVQLTGTGTGSYTFTADTVDPNGAVETSTEGNTSIGHIDNYSLSYPAQAGDPITIESPSPVGGIADMPDVPGAHLDGSASDRSRIPVPAEVAVAFAAGVLALGGAAWYARRRYSVRRR